MMSHIGQIVNAITNLSGLFLSKLAAAESIQKADRIHIRISPQDLERISASI